MKWFNSHKLLVVATLLAITFRFYNLGELPALNADEASIGYNAYSLIKTGLDEHSNPWPIHFQSFNDYKPGLTFYIALPFVYFLGLNEPALRIPGAIFGVGSVIALWFLVESLFPNSNKTKNNLKLSDISALLLATSPWHIHFSRGLWEVNIASFFIILTLLFFLKGFKNSKHFVYSVIFACLALYTYHAARVVLPLIGLGLLSIKYKQIFSLESKRMFFGSGLLALVLLLPLFQDLAGPAGTARAGGVSIFSDRGSVDRINAKRGEHNSLGSLGAKLLHNKPLEYTISFSENYLEHFWGEFLFLSGDDIQRNKVPEMGLLYLFQFPLIIVALFSIAKNSKGWGLVFIWLLAAPVAAALTFQSPHALRSQSMSIPLTIISSYGFIVTMSFLKKRGGKVAFTISMLVALSLFVWSTSRYLHQYHGHMAKTYPFSSQYGVKELVAYVETRKDEFDEIRVTNRYDQPYILFLFYMKYPPSEFQKNHVLTERDIFGFSTVDNFDKYGFSQIKWDEVRDMRNVLIAGSGEEIHEDEANVVEVVNFPNGKPAFEVVEIK